MRNIKSLLSHDLSTARISLCVPMNQVPAHINQRSQHLWHNSRELLVKFANAQAAGGVSKPPEEIFHLRGDLAYVASGHHTASQWLQQQ